MDRSAAPSRPQSRSRLRWGALFVLPALAFSPLVFTRPVAAVRATLTPVADARVEEGDPTANFGTSSRLGADASPGEQSYLRFSVPAGTTAVTRATLRLWVVDSTGDGPQVRATGPAWEESSITWANRPAAGPVVADVGRLSRGSWATYDVTAAVRGPGPVAFLLEPESSDGADFASREASNDPELVVESTSSDATSETSFPASIDAHVEESRPSRNFGSERTLKVQGGSDPDKAAYLRFPVTGLSGSVQRATLRLFVTNGTDDGPTVAPTSGTWTESGITWANRPGPTGAVVTDAGTVDTDWIELDVTSVVTGNGTFNLLLRSGSSDSFAARSSEASSRQRPELVVVTGPTSTTSSSTSTSSTSTSSTSTSSTSTSSTSTSSSSTSSSTTSSTTTTAPPAPERPVAEAGEPWLGLARIVTHACDPDCIESTYSLSVEDVAASDSGDRRVAFRWPAGGSAVLRLEWDRSSPASGCATPAAVSMDVSMRRPGAGPIGSAVWSAAIPRTCAGALERTIHFDADPMDGNRDADWFGVMELYGRLVGGDEGGADSRGAPPADPGDAVGRHARGHLVAGGVMVGWHEDGDDPVALAANEETLGEPFGLVRTYESDWEPPSLRVRNWMAEGKYVLWSVKPPDDAGGHDDWTPVATGTEDAMIRQQISLLQTWAATSGTTVGYIFNHEPHDDADTPGVVDDCEKPGDRDFPCAGTAAEFIDVYQRVRGIIDDLGADRVHLVYTATLSRAVATAPGSSVLGSGDPMTGFGGAPGESVIDAVDLIAHDSYNWYCFRASCNWEFPDEFGAWGRGVELAAAQGKQLIIAETASHPGCPDGNPSTVFRCQDEDPGDLPSPTRDEWLLRIGTWLESDERARRWIVGFAYFHALHTNDWRFADQTGLTSAGRDGWRDVFVVDSAYNDALGGHDYFAQYGFNNL